MPQRSMVAGPLCFLAAQFISVKGVVVTGESQHWLLAG
jgi:hypothetical protein